MDGRRIVGVGNIYASESLFRAGINPRKRAGKISLEKSDEARRRRSRHTLHAAIRAGGSTLRDFVGADGAAGYASSATTCTTAPGRNAAAAARRSASCVQGQRSTYFCPTCQK